MVVLENHTARFQHWTLMPFDALDLYFNIPPGSLAEY
jgi:hypothetical protein